MNLNIYIYICTHDVVTVEQLNTWKDPTEASWLQAIRLMNLWAQVEQVEPVDWWKEL